MRLSYRIASVVISVAAIGCCLAFGASAQSPTVSFETTDREMNTAIAEARRNLPRFLDSFRARSAENYSVKIAIPVRKPNDHEHIWMRLEAVEGDAVVGRISNQPVDIPKLRLGDPYRASTAMISDWGYWQGGLRHGNYTTRVILSRIPAKDAEPIRRTLSKEP